LPTQWKTANVSAIYKKGKKSEVNNYRPVSLTCITCKLLESVVKDKIMDHFLTNKLFSDKQFGFLKGSSTVTQLLTIMEYCTEMLETGGRIDVIYTDLEKAFYKIPHRRLISKLYSYGLNENIILWIKAFLADRKQRVTINGVTSHWGDVLSGVPQGSILGPLLFIIYINDLVDFCGDDAYLFLFADDANFFQHFANTVDVSILQNKIDRFTEWTDKWLIIIIAGVPLTGA